jgi:hypothetical protein
MAAERQPMGKPLTGLPRSSRLILSDISDGMVETVLREILIG